jgi:predicted hydrolase (HD superfamily)
MPGSLACMGRAEWARALARRLLEEPLPQRWAHTQGVAAQAHRLATIVGDDADLLESAAWLHDIGYSPDLATTGFHPLDGARYLCHIETADSRLCCLVAHHTCAVFEAEERGLANELIGEFPKVRDDLTNALIYCDMTVGPQGREVTVDYRIAEICRRYGMDHIVSRSILAAAPTLVAAVHDIADLKAGSRNAHRSKPQEPG